jgi:glycosyltransferase involved in cell wall biosynthesis
MIKVLALTGRISQSVLMDTAQRFSERGVELSVMCDFDVSDLEIPASLAEIRGRVLDDQTGEADYPARVRATPVARRRWARFHTDPWFRARARHANLIVALDQGSVHAVWELAQRLRRPQAVYGLAPALALLDKHRDGSLPPAVSAVGYVPVVGRRMAHGTRRRAITMTKSAARAAASPMVMRSRLGARAWTAVVAAPGLPPRVRTKIAYRAHMSMLAADRAERAVATTEAALAHLPKAEQRAALLMREAMSEAAQGTPPSLSRAMTAQLAVADAELAAGRWRKAAGAVYAAERLLFHRALHFDRMNSPLMDDPDRFLAEWRQSTAIAALSAPRGRSAAAASPPSDRPLRLLIATNGNANFLTEITQLFADRSDVEVRFLDLAADERRAKLAGATKLMIEQVLAGTTAYGGRVDEWLAPHVGWADTIFIDWCVAAAVMFSMIDPGTTRVIVRLHSFEAFAFWPHLVDFDRVDDLIFVSDHLYDLGVAVLPQLAAARTRLHVLSNAMDLTRFVRPKPAHARFMLGLVGIGSIAKDPRWAVEVVRELHRVDDRYRLVLMGSEINPKVGRSAAEYAELLEEDISATDAVELAGHVDDVPAALTEVGVILSSSVRESFHCALVEGVASGAIPVVRDWPFFAGRKHSARSLFPTEWVVDTPREAAARILDVTRDEDVWRAAGGSASRTAIERWDWAVARDGYEELILGEIGAAGGSALAHPHHESATSATSR